MKLRLLLAVLFLLAACSAVIANRGQKCADNYCPARHGECHCRLCSAKSNCGYRQCKAW